MAWKNANAMNTAEPRKSGRSGQYMSNSEVVTLDAASAYTSEIDMLPDGKDWSVAVVAGALSHSVTPSICEGDSGSKGVIVSGTLIGTAGGCVTIPYLNASYSERRSYFVKLVSSTAAQSSKTVTVLINASRGNA